MGEAATAADQFGAGLDDLNATMQASVDGTPIDVASAETAAKKFTEQARDAMDRCLAAPRQAAGLLTARRAFIPLWEGGEGGVSRTAGGVRRP